MTVSDEIGLVWFRRDLRLDDNPAWAAATSEHRFVVPLFVIDPRLVDRAGPYRRRQLLATVQALDYALAQSGGRLLVRTGDPVQVVPETVAALSVGAVYLERRRDPVRHRPATTRSRPRCRCRCSAGGARWCTRPVRC